jgi:heat shock protein beta
MDMIVNSLYSNKDIFLRELVSNASDALDKARFISIERPEVLFTKQELEIRIRGNEKLHTLTIEDDGMGMTRDELINNLGTIARSGTGKFIEALREQQSGENFDQIGQFGVGFYSAFLVAKKVKFQTRHPDSNKQWVWESTTGSHQYKVYEDVTEDIVRGSRITLELKDDCLHYLDTVKLQGLIKQYSEFIAFPIKVWVADDVDRQVVDKDMTIKRQQFEDNKAKDERRQPIKVEPVMKTEWKKEWKFTLMNDSKPIWQRKIKNVSSEEYTEFYKATFKEFLDPLAHSHFAVEGMYEFKGLIFIPGLAPFDFSRDMRSSSKNIRLYVKKVFISDAFQEELVPTWLSFVKGVIDSADLSLNVSREILQESRAVKTIRKQIVSKSLAMIKSLQDDKERWKTFWECFGKNIKMGIVEDNSCRDDLARLCRFHTSYESNTTSANMTNLDDYVSRMKEGQRGIYYFATKKTKAVVKAPFLEKLVKKASSFLFILCCL